jgi:short-subunit dehydrogenase
MGRFDGQAILITGASSGIGAALALEVARQGANVALLARRTERLAEVAERVRALGRRALPLMCDVTRDGDLERAAAACREQLGRIDVVVANAGFGVAGHLENLTLDDYRRQLETNLFGVLRTVYATLADLARSRGTLVIMGSVAGYLPGPGSSPYAASKHAVRSLAESLRLELAGRGIAVVLVSPGFVESEIRRVDNQGRLHEHAPDAVPRWLRMSADAAARTIARAIAGRRRECIVTLHGKLAVLVARLAPWLVRGLAGRLRRRPRRAGQT